MPNLLAGQPGARADGGDNGVLQTVGRERNDGFMDVVVANDQRQVTRLWSPREQDWIETPFPARIVQVDASGRRTVNQARIGVLLIRPAFPCCWCRNERSGGRLGGFDGAKWVADDRLLAGLEIDGQPIFSGREGRDHGVRLVDVDNDGCCELLVANPGAAGRLRSGAKISIPWQKSRLGARRKWRLVCRCAGSRCRHAAGPMWTPMACGT